MQSITILIVLFAAFCKSATSKEWTYSTVAFTTQGQPCFTDCVEGRCYVDVDNPSIECFSTGVPAPKFRTKSGVYCVSNCGYFGQQYEICATTLDTKKIEYCNSGDDDHLSAHGERCSSKCELSSQGFYWCRVGNSWQFCSPPKEEREEVTEAPDFSIEII